MESLLDRSFKGGQNTADSHFSRMSSALSNLEAEYISSKGMEFLTVQVKSACTVTNEIITDRNNLKGWLNALNNANEDME